ncbi:hypothetical protein BDK51DRAFT_24610, partial [Blyttiomyces helicus]
PLHTSIGFGMYLICQLFGSVISLAFISPVVLAPLGSAGLIFNVLFSRLFLGTRITMYDWSGTLLIVVGCAIVSTFGSGTPEDKQTIEDLIRLFSRPTFIAYFTVQGLIVLFLFLLIKYLEYGLGPLAARRRKTTEYVGVLYAVLGGTVASETLLLTKSWVELLIVSVLERENQFHGYFSFCVLAVLCFTVFLQLYSLNRGLHYALPVLVVPLFYTLYTVLSLANSIIYLDQSDLYSLPDLICIAIGVGVIVGGVWMLRAGQMPGGGGGGGRQGRR